MGCFCGWGQSSEGWAGEVDKPSEIGTGTSITVTTAKGIGKVCSETEQHSRVWDRLMKWANLRFYTWSLCQVLQGVEVSHWVKAPKEFTWIEFMGYARGIHNKNRGNKGQIWDVIAHFLPLLKRNWLQAGKTSALVHVRYIILSLWFAFDFISFENIVSLTQGLVADDCFLLFFSWSLRIGVVLNENQRIVSWKTWKFTMGSWWSTSICSSLIIWGSASVSVS